MTVYYLPRRQMQLPAATLRQRIVMRDQYQRGALRVVQFQHQFDNLRAGSGVEISGGLVGKQYLGLDDKGARNGYALLLAAGKMFG